MTKTGMLKTYKQLIEKLGYTIIFDGSEPEKDSAIFFVLFKQNPDNPREPNYTFFEIFTGAPLSLDGFEETVINQRNVDDFIQMIEARVRVSTINKSGMLACLLTEHYLIDDIYIIVDGKGNRDIKLSKAKLKTLSHWVNFKGGIDPRKRGEPEKV